MADDRRPIVPSLARRLVDSQFPQWAHLPIRRVAEDGWDNSTFRLGGGMKLRFPTAAGYVPQVRKEFDWLPKLAPHLPRAIPEPIATGEPGFGYDWPWAIQRWLGGQPASSVGTALSDGFALSLAEFLKALQAAPTDGAPVAGPESFHRGGHLGVYEEEALACLDRLPSDIAVERLRAYWCDAMASVWQWPGVWVHGDFAAGNILVENGDLSAVIDFGCAAVGDPACDLTIGWTLLDRPARSVFRSATGLDDGTWNRARGWAIWKAALTITQTTNENPAHGRARGVLEAILAD